MILDYTPLLARVSGTDLAPLSEIAGPRSIQALRHGDLPRWRSLLEGLPVASPSRVELQDSVTIGQTADMDVGDQERLTAGLEALLPWRKGPFHLFGVHIDAEWQCQIKWGRLAPHISPLAGRRVLDVGCGNGYYALRMAGAGAALTLGLEPHLPYVMQYWALKSYLNEVSCWVLPASLEQLPPALSAFDTVFSMGVLYHTRSPIEHLVALRGALRPGGELVLETLVVDGPAGYSLTPAQRYARMPNVWFVPSVQTTLDWLARSGFCDAHIIDVSITTTQEQRSTPWMPFASLVDGLDASDPSLTTEGLPAPRRMLVIAQRPI